MDENLKNLFVKTMKPWACFFVNILAAKGYQQSCVQMAKAGYPPSSNKFDICVLDVMMPKKDGFTLAQEIRSANAEIPIIFLTAKVLKEDILEGFKIGADDYITNRSQWRNWYFV